MTHPKPYGARERKTLLAASRLLSQAWRFYQIRGAARRWYDLWALTPRSVNAVVAAVDATESAAYAWSDGP